MGGIQITGCASHQVYQEIPGIDIRKKGGTSHVKNSTSRIYFSDDAPYQDDTAIKKEILSECNISETLVNAIYQYSEKFSVPLVSDVSAVVYENFTEKNEIAINHNKRILSVLVTDATPDVPVDDNTSAPAALSVIFKVHKNYEIIFSKFKECRTKMASVLGRAPSVCNKLERCADNIGESIAKWLKREFYSEQKKSEIDSN